MKEFTEARRPKPREDPSWQSAPVISEFLAKMRRAMSGVRHAQSVKLCDVHHTMSPCGLV